MVSCNETVIGGRLSRVQIRRKGRQEPNRLGEYVGEECEGKDTNCFRFMTQNINGIGQEGNNIKEKSFKEFIQTFKIDVMACQQLDVCWDRVRNRNKIWDRFRGWKEDSKLSVAYSTDDIDRKPYQPGGAAVITTGKMTHTWDSSGVDSKRLGRWACTRLQGSCGRYVRMISIYRPYKNTTNLNSAYMAQYRYSLKNKGGKCPRELFLEDLQQEINEWLELGDSIIVAGDFNEDIRSEQINNWKERLGLEDVFMERVEDISLLPATFNKGVNPIDTIMCTAGITVVKAGYLPFGEGIGDHRPLFMDVTIASTLGVKLTTPKNVVARRLKTLDPRVVRKYNKLLKRFYRQFSLVDQVSLLQERATYPLSDEDASTFERLDEIRIRGMVYAEKRCRKLKMGGIPWTPELSNIRLSIEVWKLVVARLKGCAVGARTIIRKKKRAGMENIETNVPIDFAMEQINTLFAEYKEYLTQKVEKRQDFQNQLATARAKEGNTKVSKEIERIQCTERQRASAQRIRRMNGSVSYSKGLAKVVVPGEEGGEVELVDKVEMEQALLDAYELILTQANQTPCMMSPLKERLGDYGTGKIVHDILLGNEIELEGVDESTKEVLKYLALKDGNRQINNPKPLMVEECQQGWKNSKERTSSAMKHGTHFGHWKVGYIDDEIAEVHTGLANIPFMTGYSPERWKFGINTLITKEHGNHRINRLRTILLYEADYNFNNKVLGRRMMEHAENNNILAPEQYGSRKNKTAIECALNKRLIFDILRQTKRPAGICSCDLKSCYDRIIHSFASIAMQRAGAPATAIESMFATIQQLKHIVRTCHGDSDRSFGGEDWRQIDPLHGIGQGNGAGPAIWAVISTVFFDLLRDKGYGFKMKAPLSKLALHLAGCGFVDDTDIFQIGLRDDDYYEVAAKLQEALNWWEQSTTVSGGAIVPQKSWYGLVQFDWVDGEWSYSSDMEDINITVKDMLGDGIELESLNPHEAKRMLGVFLAMDGSNTVQIKHMRKVAVGWYEKVRVGHLSRIDAWLALHSTIMKTLEYPLLAVTLKEAECNSIMAPILTGGLPKIGISRSMARSLVYAPLKYQGLDLHNLYTTQGLVHLRGLMNHIWQGTETGKLLLTSLEYAKMEVGIIGSYFNKDYSVYGHLGEDIWVKHLWKFIYDSGIQIDDNIKDFPMVREGDSTLSEHFATAYINRKITKAEWGKANRCRVYLKVLTVGDIASGDGRSIDAGMKKGKFNISRARNLEWQTQGYPKKTDWYVWSKVLKESLLNPLGTLNSPLGRWLHHADKIYKEEWEWWIDKDKNCLFRLVKGKWYQFNSVYRRKKRRGVQDSFRYYVPMVEPPLIHLLVRTSVQCVHGAYITQGYHTQVEVETIRKDEVASLERLMEVLSLREGEQWALHNLKTTECIDDIVMDIATGKAVGVSDGSFKDEAGTAAWIIENELGTQRIMGTVVVPGYGSDQSAYRSEIAGLYAMVLVVEMIKEVWGLSKGGILMGCDGIEALNQSLNIQKNMTVCHQQQFDILSGIQGYVRTSNIEYLPFHVKGHQDSKKKLEDLNRLELMNVEVDLYAKDFWAEKYAPALIKQRKYLKYKLPMGMWNVSFMGTRVINNLIPFLRESIEGGKAAEYWVNKRKRFNKDSFFEVDWEASKGAMKSVGIARKHWVTKFESGMCGTGRMMKIWNQRVIDNCPRCGVANEDTTHILKCPSASAQAVWQNSLLTLDEWLQTKKTCPDLRKLLLHILERWRLGLEVTNLSTCQFEWCGNVFAAQQMIGWRQLMGGCLTIEWARAQDKYYKWVGMRRTGKRWVISLIKRLWEISWNIWDDRNGVLHNTPMAADLSGAASLDKAIREEYQLGSEGLPTPVRSQFPRDIEKLLKASLIQRKSWLVLVRASRELVNDNRIQDEFTNPRSYLRKWVGL